MLYTIDDLLKALREVEEYQRNQPATPEGVRVGDMAKDSITGIEHLLTRLTQYTTLPMEYWLSEQFK